MIFPVCHWSSSAGGFPPYSVVYDADDTWVAPFTGNVSVECWGAGGNGAAGDGVDFGGGGGGGGAYSKLNTFAVTSASGYTVSVAPDSTEDTYFDTSGTVMAKSGSDGATSSGGSGGAAGSGVGDTKYSGGDGEDANGTSDSYGGGGGDTWGGRGDDDMAKRYVLSPIIGDGSSPANAFRVAVRDVSQTNSNAIIPSLPNGHPKFNFALAVVGTLNLPGVLAVSNAYVFPEYPLDARMDGMEPSTRTAMVQSIEAYDLDGNGLHLVADHVDSDSYRDVITSIGQQIEPVFNLNNFDTAEPTP